MSSARLLTIPIVGVLLGAPILFAGDFSSYRGFRFGMDLSVAAKSAGMKSTDAKVVHQRPAVIQELSWQPNSRYLADSAKTDPVKEDSLFFFNGELFRMVITYDRYKVEGMTSEDLIDAISMSYGAATRPSVEIAFHSDFGEAAKVIARWEDSQYSCNLVQTGDRTSFALVLYSKRLDALAQTAIVEAARLDAQEAPQREIEEQMKRAQEERVILNKARSVNVPNFRP